MATKMPNPTKEQIDRSRKNLYARANAPLSTHKDKDINTILDALTIAESDIAALRSLVRRMREALKSNNIWPAEVDVLCAEADKVLEAPETSAPKES